MRFDDYLELIMSDMKISDEEQEKKNGQLKLRWAIHFFKIQGDL